MVSFGAAPALLLYHWSLYRFEMLGLFVCFVFVACGAIRLARRYEALDLVDHVRIALEEAIPEKHASTSELPITRSSGPYDRIE